MVNADSFKLPPGLKFVWREVREHYNESGMIMFRELLAVKVMDSRGETYKLTWSGD